MNQTSQPSVTDAMNRVAETAELDLTSADTLRLFQRYLSSLVVAGEPQDAYDLIRGLTRLLAQHPEIMQRPSEFSRGYAEILDIAKALVLNMLTNDEVVAYMEKGIVAALRVPDVDVVETLDVAIHLQPFVEEMDDFKKKLAHALSQNHERLTLQSLRTGHGIVPPTVHDWIDVAKQYTMEFDRPLSYAIQDDENFTSLHKGEQDIVIRTMVIHDLLTTPSNRPYNYGSTISVRGTDGNMYVIEDDEVRPAYEKKDEDLLKKVMAPAHTGTAAPIAPQPPKVEDVRESLKKLEGEKKPTDDTRYASQEEMIKETGSDVGKVVAKLAQAIDADDRDAVIVSLSVLARFGALEAAMRDEHIRTSFEEHFVSALATKSGVPTDLAFEITVKNFAAPATIASFLYWALQRATDDDEESARIGNQISSVVAALGNPEFSKMIYFDITKKSYQWTPVALKQDGTLAWAA